MGPAGMCVCIYTHTHVCVHVHKGVCVYVYKGVRVYMYTSLLQGRETYRSLLSAS